MDLLLDSDTTKLKLGADQDLSIYHDGSNTYINNATGNTRFDLSTSSITQFVDSTGTFQFWNFDASTFVMQTSNKELRLQQNGDQYGTTKLRLMNRGGVNGAMFDASESSVALIDFVFKTSADQRNIRYESKGADVRFSAPEFQIGLSGNAGPFYVYDTGIGVSTTSGNPTFKHTGYITAVTARKYIQWQVSDTDDYFKLTRQDANILGFSVDMPMLITDKIIFTQTDGNESIDSIDNYMLYNATLGHLFNATIDITTTTDPQLRLTHTDGVDECDFWVNSDGDLEIMPTSRTIYLGDGTAGDSTFGFYGNTSVYTLVHDDADGTLKLSANDATNNTQIADNGTISFNGTAGIVLPHLEQSDTTDQAIADITDEQVITFNTDVHHNLWTRTSSSRFTCTHESSYHIDISACMVGASGKQIVIWLKKNGTNVANTATYYTFKSTGNNAVVTVAFLQHFAVNDYFELWMWGDSTTNKLYTIGAVAENAGVTPAIPACPSIILTVNLAGKD